MCLLRWRSKSTKHDALACTYILLVLLLDCCDFFCTVEVGMKRKIKDTEAERGKTRKEGGEKQEAKLGLNIFPNLFYSSAL